MDRLPQQGMDEHHKTGEQVWHPLEETINNVRTAFYVDAEAVLAKLPRRGIPMILRQVDGETTKPYSFSGMQKIVHEMRDKIGLPSTFTLDACRHGGMTELEEAESTDGQGSLFPLTKANSPMRATPNAPWSERWQQTGSATRIC